MNPHCARHGCWQLSLRGGLRVWLAICLLCVAGSGCTTVFSKPVTSATQSTLPWLAGFAAPPVESAAPFDLTLIQPAPRSGTGPDDLLEITIWDLYEPGKPHTFPARVDAQGRIVVPHLDEFVVTGFSPAEIEAKLVETYRRQELLKQPRVLVRELGSTPVHAYVTGAVQRPGLINLPRREASVFATLIAAGGLSRNAGLNVHVSDQGRSQPTGQPQSGLTATPHPPQMAGNAGITLPGSTVNPVTPINNPATLINRVPPPEPPQQEQPPTPDEGHSEPVPQQLVNHSDSITVSADGLSPLDARLPGKVEATGSNIEETVATRPEAHPNPIPQSQPGHWFDLTVERDREALKQLVLHDGDVVTVRPAAPPVRITGAVVQPGAYRTPAGNALNLGDAIQLAGGLGANDTHVVIVLTRPATSESSLRRWTFRMGPGEKLPANMPAIQPGDQVHVEPTAQARVQSLMGSLWPGK